MGKGDKKSKKGKISMGTFGASRPRKRASASAIAAAAKPAVAEKPAAAAKKAAKK